MSWTNPDVTPVGVARNASGQPVSVRRRGWGRVVVGAALLVVGVVTAAAGILESIDHRSDALDGAVGRGVLEGVGPTEPVPFVADDTTGDDFTIYLDTPDSGNDVPLEREVQSTTCEVDLADGTHATVLGRRQGTASDIGGLRSIGGFSAPPGNTVVTCEWREPTRHDRGRADSRGFVVSPGKPSDAAGGQQLTLGGITAALAGGALLAWGLHGRHELA